MNKQDIRQQMINKRRSLIRKEVIDKSFLIEEHLLSVEAIQNARTIMTYIDINGEVITRYFAQNALNAGKRIVVPVCIPESGKLLASEILNLSELELGYMGLFEPIKDFIRPIDTKDLNVVIIPCVALDFNGNRIGYGKGYYDRFLSELSPSVMKIGLAFEFQLVPNIISEYFDVPVDLIITEKDIIKATSK